MTTLFASIVYGWMSVSGAMTMSPIHGKGDSRDCGSHTFQMDSGDRVTVVITCERVSPVQGHR